MNEADLRARWLSALTASQPYREAQLAVELDKAKRGAKYAKALKGVTGAEERAVLMQKQRDEVGSGPGEIQLEAMQNAHKAEVDRYIQTATKDHAVQAAKGDFTMRYQAEPNFADHAPYIEPGYFHIGGGEPTGTHAAALKTAVKSGAGKKFEPSGDPALDRATQEMVEQQKVAAAVQNARKVRLQEIQNNRPRDRINVNDFRFNQGGTIETGGRTFTVDPGIGRQPMTTVERPGDAGKIDSFGRLRGSDVQVKAPDPIDVSDQLKMPAAPRRQATPMVF